MNTHIRRFLTGSAALISFLAVSITIAWALLNAPLFLLIALAFAPFAYAIGTLIEVDGEVNRRLKGDWQ